MVSVYESSDGQWIVFSGEVKTFFTTQAEARNMSEKLIYTENALAAMTQLIQLAEALPGIRQTYTDRLYAIGEADEITDSDIEGETGKTALELEAGMTLIDNFLKFLDSDGTQVTALYRATLSKLRTDM